MTPAPFSSPLSSFSFCAPWIYSFVSPASSFCVSVPLCRGLHLTSPAFTCRPLSTLLSSKLCAKHTILPLFCVSSALSLDGREVLPSCCWPTCGRSLHLRKTRHNISASCSCIVAHDFIYETVTLLSCLQVECLRCGLLTWAALMWGLTGVATSTWKPALLAQAVSFAALWSWSLYSD